MACCSSKRKWRYPLGILAAVGAAILLTHLPAGAPMALAGDTIRGHEEFSALLKKYVGANGGVDYAALKNDEAKLDRYLATLGKANPNAGSRAHQLAFYINAYNAFTLKLILQHHGKIKSIRDIKKPWDQRVWVIGGQKFSLNQIEHSVLRERLKEPRIHFAIVCASIGCPDLWSQAYSEKNIEAELDAAARRFLQAKKHIQTSLTKGREGQGKQRLYVSKIFSWFGNDFKQNGGTVAGFIAKYATPETAAYIQNSGKHLRIEYLDYDWNLNTK